MIPSHTQPKNVKNVLVLLQKFELKTNTTKTFKFLDMEEFSEAVFLLSMSRILMPNYKWGTVKNDSMIGNKFGCVSSRDRAKRPS